MHDAWWSSVGVTRLRVVVVIESTPKPSKLKLSKLSKVHFIVTPKGTQFFNIILFKNMFFKKLNATLHMWTLGCLS
jgi:hypothetical protein